MLYLCSIYAPSMPLRDESERDERGQSMPYPCHVHTPFHALYMSYPFPVHPRPFPVHSPPMPRLFTVYAPSMPRSRRLFTVHTVSILYLYCIYAVSMLRPHHPLS